MASDYLLEELSALLLTTLFLFPCGHHQAAELPDKGVFHQCWDGFNCWQARSKAHLKPVVLMVSKIEEAAFKRLSNLGIGAIVRPVVDVIAKITAPLDDAFLAFVMP